MKVSCEIIKDLLPLYKDEICSDDSRKMIDEHLLECDECKEEYKLMNEDISLNDDFVKNNIKEANELMNLSKKWNKKLMLEILKGIGIGVVSVVIVIIFISIFVGIKVG